MTPNDVWLLVKKIAVGILISVVPLAILSGGLWLTQRLANRHTHDQQPSSAKVLSHAN
jgi:hypothetical protein